VGQPEVGGTPPGFVGAGQQRAGTHALQIGAGQHVSLGRPTDLLFGSEVNFSVAFWVRGDAGAWTSDPVFIGTKNWTSGGNQGFVVAAQGNGGWKWNWKGSAVARRDTPNIGVITDGTWHHIAVTHDRNGVATFYVDGELNSTIPIAGDGDIDALDINVGNDGTARYGFDNDTGARFVNARLDDLGIWRRILTAQEVAAIHTAGQAGNDLSSATVGAGPLRIESVTLSANNLAITWSGEPGLRLQSSSTIANPDWQDVPNTSGQNSATVPITGMTGFFRLAK
jgi:hypothetical protein